MSQPEPTVQATQYTVSVLPESDINRGHFEVTVEYRGEGRWAVLHHRWCLGADGAWEFEPRPSSREDEWLETHRFDLETALRLAKEAAPDLRVNGVTAAEAVARGAR